MAEGCVCPKLHVQAARHASIASRCAAECFFCAIKVVWGVAGAIMPSLY